MFNCGCRHCYSTTPVPDHFSHLTLAENFEMPFEPQFNATPIQPGVYKNEINAFLNLQSKESVGEINWNYKDGFNESWNTSDL